MPAVISSAVSVTTTATLLVASTPNATRTIYIEPIGTDVHLGGDNVTTANGITTKKDVITTFVLPPLNDLYAVTATGTVSVLVLKPSGDF